jgi:Bacteriophage baseplate protein W
VTSLLPATTDHLRDRLGVGVSFPFEPEPRGRPAWLAGPALVRQSIELIIQTEPGERVMRPLFGCGLRQFLMEPNTPATRARIARDLEAAIKAWEPRVEVRGVDALPTDDPSVVLVTITYAHVRDGSSSTLEFPMGVGEQGT